MFLPNFLAVGLTVALAPPGPPTPPAPPAPSLAAEPSDTDAGPILHPNLAAQAPRGEWTWEGSETGPPPPRDDSRIRKLRRNAVALIAGGTVTVVGGAAFFAGLGITSSKPGDKLAALGNDDGALPVGDAKRQRLIRLAEVGPPLMISGIVLETAGLVTLLVAGARLRKIRAAGYAKDKQLSFSFAPARGGAAVVVGGRF